MTEPTFESVTSFYTHAVSAAPDAIAFCTESRQYTYRELYLRSSGIAAALQAKFPAGSRIGVLMSRSFELYAAIWGILSAGMTFVPMDAGYPQERIDFILNDSEAAAVLCDDSSFFECQAACKMHIADFADLDENASFDAVCNPEALIAVFYTSGSSGTPKGILTKQAAMAKQIIRFAVYLGLDNTSRFLFKTPVSFHAAIYEYFMCMYVGGCACILESGKEQDPEQLVQAITNHQITALFAVPSMLQNIAQYCRVHQVRLDSLHQIWAAGEALYQATVDKMLPYTNAALYSSFGGSEYAGMIAACPCEIGVDQIVVPIGKIFDGIDYVLLDESMQPAKQGILYVNTAVTGSRYKDDARNEGRFLTDDANARTLFCSNDTFIEENGILRFLGRSDDVVKIRGMRVDPGEVEGCLRAVDAVTDAAVLAEDGKLTAYLVQDGLQDDRSFVRIVTEALQAKLPAYMIPSVWMLTDHLPKLTSGKKDRKKIKQCACRRILLSTDTEKPQSDLQKEIFAVWSDILHTDAFGIHDHFSELGGVSIEIAAMTETLSEKYGVALRYTDFMENPTVAGLAELIESGKKPLLSRKTLLGAPEAEPYDKPFPLTSLQQSYLVERTDASGTDGVSTHAYFEISVLHYDYQKICDILQQITDSTPSLRIVVRPDGTQYIASSAAVRVSEWIPDADISFETALESLRQKLNRQILDLSHAPLFEAVCVPKDNGSGTVILLTDNLILDGMSCIRLVNAFTAAYSGAEIAVNHADYSFYDYAAYLRKLKESALHHEDEAFWLDFAKQFPDAVKLPAEQSKNPETVPAIQVLRLSPALWSSLEHSAASQQISVFMLVLTALIQSLSKYNYERRFYIGIPGENRPSFEPAFQDMLGEFSSFFLFPCDVNTEESFVDAAKKYQKQLWTLKEHDSFDAIELLRAMNQQSGSSGSHHVPVVFTSLLDTENQNNAEASLSYMQSHTANVDLEIVLYRAENEVRVNFTYLQGHLSEQTVNGLAEMLRMTLEHIADEPQAMTQYLSPAIPASDAAVLAALRENQKPLPEQSVRDLLLTGFAKQPDHIAIAEETNTYSYADVQQIAVNIAAALDACADEEIIAVYLPKCAMQIMAVLGIVFAGKAYLPVEYDYPPERVRECILHAGVKTVLTNAESSPIFADTGIKTLDPETVPAAAARALPPVSELFALIYTSGSTGKPKAVKVLQKGVVNCLLDTIETFAISEQDTAIALTNIAHDMSMFDMFGMLAAGGCIAVPQEQDKTNALSWHDLILSRHVTVWNSVPALMENYLDTLETAGIQAELPLRVVFLGGDKIAPSIHPRLRRITPDVQTVSVGGPTETTLWNIWHIITDHDAESGFIPYGKPIQNTVYSIRNENLEEMPIGAEGIMFCEGIGVTAGYLNQPEETKKRYLHTETGNVRYLTGDVGCYLPDGNIRITGRKDHQVKLLGKRIELEEIERCIQQYPGIKQCVVCTDGTRLAAFMLAAEAPDETALRADLAKYLPAYMIPSRFCTIAAFPLTFNGKIDRNALLASLPQETTQQDNMPLTESEQKLYQIVCEVLHLEAFDPSENLYYLGMNSLNAILIINRMQLQHGMRIPVREFMEKNTLRDIASILPHAAEPIKAFKLSPEKRYQPFPLTELQEAYVVGRDPAIPLGGRPSCGYGELQWKNFDPERFLTALYALVKRHDALRCVIRSDKSQIILKDCPALTVPVKDVSMCSESEQQAWIMHQRKESEKICIPPEELPKFRFTATKLSAEDYIVHMYFDLLIADGWSIHLFLDELDALYHDPEAVLPSSSVSFRDYSDYKEMLKTTAQYEADKQYWLDKLPDLPDAVSLPLLCDPSELKQITTSQEECSLSSAEWDQLNALAQAYSVTPFAVLFTVFNHVILRWNQKQRLLMCMPETDRPMFHPDVQNMMGECSSFYVFTAEHFRGQSFADAVRATQEQLWQLYEHKLFTGVEVLREIYKYRDSYGQALIPIVFSTILNYPPAQKQHFSMVYDHTFTSQIMVDIDVQRIGDRVKFNWNYVDGLLSRQMVHEMAAIQMETLHRALASDTFWQQPLSLPLPARSQDLISAANASGGTLAITKPLCAYFADAFRQYADHPCICCGDVTYSYQDVFGFIAAIGKQFRKMDLCPGDTVAIHCKKSAEQAAAILAAVYFGLVYVPLEYELPEQTVRQCMERCACKAMIVSAEKVELFRNAAAVIPAETLLTDLPETNEMPLPAEPALDAPFAVIHTSGSTGMPKAVLLKQQGIINALLFSQKEFDLRDTDKAICLTNIAHDMSMFDLFGMILCGGCMVIPEHAQTKDPLVWMALIKKHQVTVWNSVPAMMEMLLATCKEEQFPSIRLVISGGDYLIPESAKKIFSVFPGVRLVNVGGPTETTLWNIYHDVTPEEAESGIIPYGKPISNTQYFLLNDVMEQVPVGVVGMMYCGGIGITAGYLKDEKQTAEKYVMSQYSDAPIYCTGDLGKYNENGEIIFMGRSDKQIKINGKRIELNGINEILRRFDGVRNSVVKLGSNQKTIFGYYIADTELDESAIKQFMLSYLPQYMIPQNIIRLDAIPLTANGKLDQAALPETVTENKTVPEKHDADLAETTVVTICRELLGNDMVNVDSNFFISGGNSLLALRFLTKIQEQLGVTMTMTDIFTSNSLRDWCEIIRTRQPAKSE